MRSGSSAHECSKWKHTRSTWPAGTQEFPGTRKHLRRACPIDLIPDPIPVLGYLDDLVLVPLGIVIARRLIPKAVLAECRERAQTVIEQGVHVGRTAAMVVIAIWILTAVGLAWLVIRSVGAFKRNGPA